MIKLTTAQKALIPIYFISFITMFSFSLVMPFLIFLIRDYGGNEIIYGAFGATYALFLLIGSPIMGSWSDRTSRRKVLFYSHFGSAIAWIIFLAALFIPDNKLFDFDNELIGKVAFGVPLLLIFISRALDGVTGGNISVAYAYLADISTAKTSKKNYGNMAAANQLGFILGPALAGLLGTTSMGYKLPVLAALAVSAIGVGFVSFLPDPAKVCMDLGISRKDCLGQQAKSKEKLSLPKALKMPNIPYMLLLYFLIFLAFNLFYTAFPVHGELALGWTSLELGFYLSALSCIMILVQGPLMNKYSDRFRDASLMIAGSFLLAINFTLMQNTTVGWLLLAAVFFALGNGTMWPSYLSMLGKVGGKSHQGAIQGIGTGAGALASIVGLLAGGFLYNSIGAYTFLISAVVITLVGFLFFKIPRLEKELKRAENQENFPS